MVARGAAARPAGRADLRRAAAQRPRDDLRPADPLPRRAARTSLGRDVSVQALPREQARIVAALRRARPRAVVRWTDPASSRPEPNRRGRPSGSRALDEYLASAYRLDAPLRRLRRAGAARSLAGARADPRAHRGARAVAGGWLAVAGARRARRGASSTRSPFGPGGSSRRRDRRAARRSCCATDRRLNPDRRPRPLRGGRARPRRPRRARRSPCLRRHRRRGAGEPRGVGAARPRRPRASDPRSPPVPAPVSASWRRRCPSG